MHIFKIVEGIADSESHLKVLMSLCTAREVTI